MEKKVIRGFLVSAAILLAATLLLHLVSDLIWGNDYVDLLEYSAEGEVSAETVSVRLEGDDALEIAECDVRSNGVYIKLHGLKRGSTKLIISVDGQPNMETLYDYSVSDSGRIVNENNGNFSAFQAHLTVTILFVAGLSGILWLAFYRAQKVLWYSYQSVFFCGFGIWTLVVTLLLVIQLTNRYNAFAVYSILHASGWQFLLLTSPLMLLFCIALCASNISLIRHESYRIQNALGIILSAILLFGMGSAIAVNLVPVSGSEASVTAHEACTAGYAAVFLMLECFLQGAVICGARAAKRIPDYDRDYIIILGCKFRKDGTLYPLIKGRVDRAIEFYHEQISRCGKHPVLVPSGGQGRDEIMPEAEAMSNYILQQGIPEADVMKEDRSRNTVENMRFSYELMNARTAQPKVAYSTTNYHVFRSGIISRQCGYEPQGMGSKTKWYFWPNAYVRECIGMVVYMRKLMIALLAGLVVSAALIVILL